MVSWNDPNDDRLRRRVRVRAAVVVVVAVVVAAAAIAGAAVGPGAAAPRGEAPVTVPAAGQARHVILLRRLRAPQAYAAGGSLYVAVQVSRPGTTVRSALLRTDSTSGAILARRALGGAFDHMLLASGRLWVTTTTGMQATLWGLDEATLRPLSRATLPGSGPDAGDAGDLAVAGGWLWVGTDSRLMRVSPLTGTVLAALPIRPAGPVGVAADRLGRTLLVVAGRERSYVQRREPVSGARMARSGRFDGVLQPVIGGVAGGYAWLSQATGMQGYVERIDARRLASARQPGTFGPPTATLIFGSNGVQARVIDGILYVTQLAGGRQRNYCAAPATGRPRAALPFHTYSALLTADRRYIYYVPEFDNPDSAEIARAPIDPRCR